jgi:Fe-S-cluster containining protein
MASRNYLRLGIGEIHSSRTRDERMNELKQMKLNVNCRNCVNKCCSQPYDWVYLTTNEISILEKASGVPEQDFVTKRKNSATGHVFRTLNLPCRFLNPDTGECTVYESRPMVCQIFPFYLEPLTGDATLLPVQCGANLQILSLDSPEAGWCLADSEEQASRWLAQLWRDAIKSE